MPDDFAERVEAADSFFPNFPWHGGHNDVFYTDDEEEKEAQRDPMSWVSSIPNPPAAIADVCTGTLSGNTATRASAEDHTTDPALSFLQRLAAWITGWPQQSQAQEQSAAGLVQSSAFVPLAFSEQRADVIPKRCLSTSLDEASAGGCGGERDSLNTMVIVDEPCLQQPPPPPVHMFESLAGSLVLPTDGGCPTGVVKRGRYENYAQTGAVLVSAFS